MDGSILRQMPHSTEAEMSVLGAVLIDGRRITDIIGLVKSEDFYIADNAEIFEAMLGLWSAGEDIDLVSLIEQLRRRGTYDRIGGRAYMAQLIDTVPTAGNIVGYANIVAEKASLRRLIEAAQEIEDMASSANDETRNIIDLSEQKIYSIAQGNNTRQLAPIKEVILGEYDRLHILAQDPNALNGTPTGFRDLDRYLIGLNNSDLCLIAARPGMGKTSFALNIARNVSIRFKKKVAVFSLEMSKEQLVSRMLSSEAKIDNYKLRTGELNDEDWVRLAEAAGTLSSSEIYIDDTSGLNVLEIKAKCRRMKDLGLVVIDYLQLMQSSRRSDNRVQEVSEISRGLKIMAKELNVPVICLSQLSRGPESRTDKRPMLSDLRESGAIEQDADEVLFLYREDYYNPDTEKRNIAECIIAKNRHGSSGKIELQWFGQYTIFTTQENTYNA